MEKVKYRYMIQYEEAYSAFYVVVDRRSSMSKIIVYLILGIFSIITLLMYVKQPQHIGYSFLSLLCVLMMFAIWANPMLKAKKGAKQVVKTNGWYEIEITNDGYINLKNGQKILINEDNDSRIYETDSIFAIRPNRKMTFCLPKRIMNDNEIYFVREVFKKYIDNYRIGGKLL